jgi:hypothetical protein
MIRSTVLLAAGAILAFATNSFAAIVTTWQTPQNIAAGSDVSTEGTQVFGRNVVYASGNPNAFVNGANFGYGNPGWLVTYADNFGATNTGALLAPVMGGPDATNYQNMLNNERFNGSLSRTMTFSNLTNGHVYLFQFWVGDWRSFTNNRTETISSSGSDVNIPTLKFADSDLSNTPGPSHGQFAIGTFTADATGSITYTINGNETTQYGLIQLRDITSVVSVPTPAALPAGLGLLAMGAIRRRR